MQKKIFSVLFIIVLFIIIQSIFISHDKLYKVSEINSPISFTIGNKEFLFKDIETFDSKYTQRNKELSINLGITEEEAFVLGNLAKQWAISLMKGRNVYIKNQDLIYFKTSYRQKFLFSGYCLLNSKPYYNEMFNKKLALVRKGNYKVLDLDTNRVYEIFDKEVRDLENFIVLRKSHLPKNIKHNLINKVFYDEKIKVILADSTINLKPDRNCTTSICQEFLTNINNSRKSIDMAIYGYSSVHKIEEALLNALKRGVKIRFVYDVDAKGINIYPDTLKLIQYIPNNINDGKSIDANNIMHNKFYIFDDKITITGSANLSHTDMSEFNTNSIIIINSPDFAKIYKTEFEQMFDGNFHTAKKSNTRKKLNFPNTNLDVYFSPQDKSITNAILPLIRNAKKYIYIPTFVLTERRVTEELILAKQRGVDVKIIIDALNASIKHSKHKELREGGILVKTENYAGKMHSKSMIVDDRYTIIGSMNFSNSGENKNDENLIVIDNEKLAMFYKTFFIYQWNKIDDRWLKSNVRAEGIDSIGSCFDGLDNNYDGKKDFEDIACKK